MKIDVNKGLIELIPWLSTLVYFSGVNKSIIGVLILIVLFLLIYINKGGLIYEYKRLIACYMFVVAVLISGYIPIIVYGQKESGFSSIFEGLRYGCAIFMIYLIFPVLIARINVFVRSLMYLSWLLVLGGYIALIYGDVSVGLIDISRYYDLRIAGYNFPTTSSFFQQSNYYAIWLLLSVVFIMFYVKPRYKELDWYLMVLMMIQICFTRSRSAFLILIIVILIKYYTVFFTAGYKKLLGLFVVSMLLILYDGTNGVKNMVWDIWINTQDAIPKFRKGLNARDGLIDLALMAWNERKMGYGFGGENDILMQSGLVDRETVQSTYLTGLLKGGYMYLLLTIGVILIAFFSKLIYYRVCAQRLSYKSNDKLLILLIVIAIIAVDGMVRSYMIGGIGFMPFLFTLSLVGSAFYRGGDLCMIDQK